MKLVQVVCLSTLAACSSRPRAPEPVAPTASPEDLALSEAVEPPAPVELPDPVDPAEVEASPEPAALPRPVDLPQAGDEPEPVELPEPEGLPEVVPAFPEAVDLHQRRREVRDAELGFAATMAARDHAAFTAFLSDHAIFLGGPQPLRGKAAIAAAWQPYFAGPDAPFAWAPDTVELLASGDLALTSGPVRAPDGQSLGRFTSIWRLEEDGWRVVFDKGD